MTQETPDHVRSALLAQLGCRWQYALTEDEWLGMGAEHPLRDPEAVWEHMRPWHHRGKVEDARAGRTAPVAGEAA